jgi:O-antigen/teichoic acid export membrane protein
MKDNFEKLKNMVNKFKDLTSLSISTIVTNGVGGIFWLYMASLLGTEGYGEISYFISIAIISSTLSLAGMSNVLIVYGAKNIKIQSTVFVIGSITSLITSLIVFFFVIEEITISLYVIGYVIFNLISADLIGRKLIQKYSKIIIIQKIILVVLSIIFYHVIGLHGVMLGIALSFLVFSFIFYKTIKEMKIDISIFKNKYKFTINSFLLDISGAFQGSLDKIIILPILGFSLLGNYQLGLQFISLLYLIPGILFSYALSQDASGISTKILKIIIVSISIIFAILGIILSPIFVPIIFPEFVESIVVIQIMSISIVPSAIAQSYVSKYLGRTKSKVVIVGAGIYLLIQIFSIITLGNMYGINGAAVSIIISSIVYSSYFVIIDQFYYKSKLET